MAGALALVATLSVTGWGGEQIQTFRLESLDRTQKLGPFKLARGNRVFIGDTPCSVEPDGERGVKITDLAMEQVYGPYEFVEGRIIKIRAISYTIVDVQTVAETTKPPVAPIPRPAPSAEAPAPSRPRMPQRPARRPPAVQPAPRTTPGRPEPELVPAWPTADVEVGIDVALLASSLYDLQIGHAYSADDSALDRQWIAAFVRRDPLTFRFGVILNAEREEDADGPLYGFSDAELGGGSGWWTSLDLSFEVFRRGRWHADVYGGLSYLQEDYELSYDTWVTVSRVVPGTNGVPDTIRQELDVAKQKEDVTLSELGLHLGTRALWDNGRWLLWGGVEFLPHVDTDLDAEILAQGESYDTEIENSYPFVVLAGLAYRVSDLKFRAEGRAGEEQRVTIGISRGF